MHTSYELVSDSFPEEVFEQLGELFSAASKLPVFLSAQSYLVAGSTVLRMVKKLGEAFAESEPYLKDDESLRFDTPDVPVSLASHALYCNRAQKGEFRDYSIKIVTDGGSSKAVMVNKNDEEYSGDAPYIIVSIDGRERPGLEDFEATAATAALLDQFYRSKQPVKTAVSVAEQGLKFYNDHQYAEKAKAVKARMASHDENSSEYKKLKVLYEAHKKNIVSDEFKLD